MKYVHKYKTDDLELFIITDSNSKPSGTTIQVPSSGWQGYGVGKNRANLISFMEGLTFTKEKEEPKEEPKKEEEKKSSVSEFIRSIAQGLK